MAETPAQFMQQWNSWDLNTRLNWLVFTGTNSPAQRTSVIRTWVTQNYGAYASYLDNPEIGPILMQAATEGWTSDRLQSAIMNTNFWKTTSDTMRKWQLLQATDPAAANQQITLLMQQITDEANNLGITLGTPGATGEQPGGPMQSSQDAVKALAIQLLGLGTTASTDISRAVAAQAQYSPTHPVGKLGDDMDTILAEARNQMVPLSNQAAFDWAQRIEMGSADANGAKDYIQQLALSAYPQLSAAIQSGQTVKQTLDPYIQQTAKLLELSPDQVDLTQQKFQPIINSKDPTTGQPTIMSLSQAADFTRGLKDYQSTADAKTQAATVAEKIGGLMGKGL